MDELKTKISVVAFLVAVYDVLQGYIRHDVRAKGVADTVVVSVAAASKEVCVALYQVFLLILRETKGVRPVDELAAALFFIIGSNFLYDVKSTLVGLGLFLVIVQFSSLELVFVELEEVLEDLI